MSGKFDLKKHYRGIDICYPGGTVLLLILVGIAMLITMLITIFSSESKEPSALPSGANLASEGPLAGKRSFRMGFSPWPYDLSLEAVRWTDKAIKEHGDIIEQHFEEGVPWPEALANRAYKPGMEKEMSSRVERMGSLPRVVSINPINVTRNGLALYRGESNNMPLPGDWSHKRFNDPSVIAAYENYVERVIETMHPDYLLIGVEVNLLQRCKDSSWTDYLQLHRAVYKAVKEKHPSLPVVASVVCTSYFTGLCSEDDSEKQRQELKKLLPYVDILGFSVHPFMSSWTAEKVPDRKFFKELFALAAGKPFAITESSYPAQKWQMWMGFTNVVFNGTEAKQEAFLKAMLDESLEERPVFVSWYSIRDYDQLCQKLPFMPTLIVWRDTGLFDENGRPRRALALWDSVLKLPRL